MITLAEEKREAHMPRLDHVNIHTHDAGPMIAFLETVLGAR